MRVGEAVTVAWIVLVGDAVAVTEAAMVGVGRLNPSPATQIFLVKRDF